MKHLLRPLTGLCVIALGSSLVACSAEGGAADDSYSITFLASSSQNGYNQAVYEGVQKRARELSAELGVTIETKIQDGQFDSTTQLSQLQNAGTTGQADGIIVVPHDGPGLAAAFPLGNSIPVVSVLNPIGSDINRMEPQVEGVVSTVASPPAEGARGQAEQVVDYCAEIDPCKIGILAGLLNSPLDIERVDTLNSVIGKHKNIQVVGTVEGAYDRDRSLAAVSNLLQANKDINGILSTADQQTLGAQIALENAGIDPSSVFLTGGGGTQEAVEAIRSGKWSAGYLMFPVTMGEAAVDQMMKSLRNEKVSSVVDADALAKFGPFVTKSDLDAHPDFVGEWNG